MSCQTAFVYKSRVACCSPVLLPVVNRFKDCDENNFLLTSEVMFFSFIALADWSQNDCFSHLNLPISVFLSEKLLNSNGRELRRALFSLKQIFQVCYIYCCSHQEKCCYMVKTIPGNYHLHGLHSCKFVINDCM